MSTEARRERLGMPQNMPDAEAVEWLRKQREQLLKKISDRRRQSEPPPGQPVQ